MSEEIKTLQDKLRRDSVVAVCEKWISYSLKISWSEHKAANLMTCVRIPAELWLLNKINILKNIEIRPVEKKELISNYLRTYKHLVNTVIQKKYFCQWSVIHILHNIIHNSNLIHFLVSSIASLRSNWMYLNKMRNQTVCILSCQISDIHQGLRVNQCDVPRVYYHIKWQVHKTFLLAIWLLLPACENIFIHSWWYRIIVILMRYNLLFWRIEDTCGWSVMTSITLYSINHYLEIIDDYQSNAWVYKLARFMPLP